MRREKWGKYYGEGQGQGKLWKTNEGWKRNIDEVLGKRTSKEWKCAVSKMDVKLYTCDRKNKIVSRGRGIIFFFEFQFNLIASFSDLSDSIHFICSLAYSFIYLLSNFSTHQFFYLLINIGTSWYLLYVLDVLIWNRTYRTYIMLHMHSAAKHRWKAISWRYQLLWHDSKIKSK